MILIQIRFSLRDLVYFQKLDKIVQVDLRHQNRDGHVSYHEIIFQMESIFSLGAGEGELREKEI